MRKQSGSKKLWIIGYQHLNIGLKDFYNLIFSEKLIKKKTRGKD